MKMIVKYDHNKNNNCFVGYSFKKKVPQKQVSIIG